MADACTFRRVDTPVDHQTDEVFNIQSQERANLLSEIKDAIHSNTVKAPLWACMQASTCKTKTLAKERDRYSCAITKGEVFEVAHIFPHCVINKKPSTNLDASIPSFWNLLDEIFKDPSNPDKSTDGCHNMICLNPTAHHLWAKGMFALRPVSLSDDRKELAVQFYWQPRPSHGRFDSVNILESPGSFQRSLEWGPTFELLDMQRHLQRIVSMSGSAEIYDEDNGDDDGDQLDVGIIHKTFSNILAWVSTPLSHSGSDDDFSR
ncbi:hypothetical protein PAAG_03456 [Paracoccidioides lutzii Pb01]|uniref:HNH nuclease domain-containing protein n=1 Tax=Paracoccidioides lutzii (strain ATCC MYA-826 / Pb01) TaxID=502779 RepID=C1GX82_PARBA|nr:hypothetical protein PAAG_03456 [Paracoccidioides lutzii Pb01]EEH41170.2 hypothetical protein PAAG_03456 [Paracoccidioides lutzii Pb01]